MQQVKPQIVKEPVTVLMPVYNASDHIGEAIESILVQTYSNFEFLIVDDASTDETVNIIRSFTDKRIRLICHSKNKGIRDTLNEGIALATTELIARMDADDISHPWRLQKQVDFLLKHTDHAMVCSLSKVIDKDRNFIRPYDPYGMDLYYGLFFDCYICHSSVMYRKSCVEAAGKYRMEYAEDFDLWWKLSRLYKIHIIREPLLLYRVHEQNHSKVHKRSEYDRAEYKIIKRNIYYLLGNRASIPGVFISCYNYDFKPLTELQDMNAVTQCIDLLNTINSHIVATENPNRNIDAIFHSAADKKQRILYGLGLNLPYFKMIKLIRHYKYNHLIWPITKNKAKRSLNIKRRVIKEFITRKRKFSFHLLLWNN